MSTREGRLLPALYTILFFVTLYSPYANADDTSAGVTLQGLRSDPAGSVTASATSVVLRNGNVQVTLTVTVRRGQGGAVLIEMPRFGWLGESETYPDRQFPELQILANGISAKIENRFAAFVGSSDVTEAILKAGVKPFAIADTPPFVAPGPGGKPAFEMLERLGAIEKSGSDYLAKWTAQRKVRVALSPGLGTLTLNYKARPGYELRRWDQISKSSNLAEYCASSSDLIKLFGRVATGMFVASDYAIPVTIDDRALTSVDIAVELPSKEDQPRSVMAFCGADGKAVISQATPIKATARMGAKGTVRLLSIARP